MKRKRQTIWLVESDPRQQADIAALLNTEFPECDLRVLPSEASFLCHLSCSRKPPVFVISEASIRWSIEDQKPPEDYPKGGFRLAGTRCWEAFRTKYLATPWIYFTILEKRDFRFGKHSDYKTKFLSKWIQNWRGRMTKTIFDLAEPIDGDSEINARLLKSPRMRKTLIKGLATPLERCSLV